MGELISETVKNADKLGTVATLILVILGMGWALAKEKLVTGGRWREKLAVCAKSESALDAANEELDAVKEQLIRLQVEKEYAWQKPQGRTRRVTE